MELRRRLLTVHPPLRVSTLVALQLAIEQEFPDAVIDFDDDGPFHVVVTETLAEDDPRAQIVAP